MASRTRKKQPKIKVRDLKARKNPKGGKGSTDITVTKPYNKASPP